MQIADTNRPGEEEKKKHCDPHMGILAITSCSMQNYEVLEFYDGLVGTTWFLKNALDPSVQINFKIILRCLQISWMISFEASQKAPLQTATDKAISLERTSGWQVEGAWLLGCALSFLRRAAIICSADCRADSCMPWDIDSWYATLHIHHRTLGAQAEWSVEVPVPLLCYLLINSRSPWP